MYLYGLIWGFLMCILVTVILFGWIIKGLGEPMDGHTFKSNVVMILTSALV